MLMAVVHKLKPNKKLKPNMLQRKLLAGNRTNHKIAPVPNHQLNTANKLAPKVEVRKSIMRVSAITKLVACEFQQAKLVFSQAAGTSGQR